MDIIKNNYIAILFVVAVTVAAVFIIYRFLRMPSEKQKKKVQEWLVWACIEAEKALQSGTGKLKLREVWNMFVSVPAFKFVANIITFDLFEKWVSDALIAAKQMIINNPVLAEYVYEENAATEVVKIKLQLEEK